jgi:transmembrane sensor
MSEERHSSSRAAVAEAAGWLVRLQREDAGASDWLAFERWLTAAPGNPAAYARIEALSQELDAMAPQLREAMAAAPAAGLRRSRPGGRAAGVTRRRWMLGAAAAAAAVGGVVLLRPGSERRPWTDGATVYEAAPGELRAVALADGTKMQLNSGSRVAVRLDRDARRVVMADAEAIFDVAHEPARPFLINVGDRQVRVVGTQFNLRRRDGKVVLTVSRGVVEVSSLKRNALAPTRVVAGEQLVHVEDTGGTTVTSVDPREAFGWTSGQLIYRDRPLSEVAADLGRRFGHVVRVADSRTGATRFTGVLVLDDEDAVLKRLTVLAPLEVVQEKDGVVIRRRN